MGDIRTAYSDANGLWWKNRYRAITEIYMAGSLMCKDFSSNLYSHIDKTEEWKNENLKQEDAVIQYYQKAQNTKVCYFAFHKFFKYLAFKGIGNRKYKEIMMLHFPVFSFLVFKVS